VLAAAEDGDRCCGGGRVEARLSLSSRRRRRSPAHLRAGPLPALAGERRRTGGGVNEKDGEREGGLAVPSVTEG
jgi:hypothetical protein